MLYAHAFSLLIIYTSSEGSTKRTSPRVHRPRAPQSPAAPRGQAVPGSCRAFGGVEVMGLVMARGAAVPVGEVGGEASKTHLLQAHQLVHFLGALHDVSSLRPEGLFRARPHPV